MAPHRLHALERGALLHLQADVERDQQQHDREQERDAPAPRLERTEAGAVSMCDRWEAGVDGDLGEHDDDERQKQRQRRGGVDPAGEVAALVLRRMLGDVDGGAAVLAAGGKALQHAQRR